MIFKKIIRRLRILHEDYLSRFFHEKCRISLDDIIIASFPRSGRTWVRFFIGSYIDYYYNLGIEVDWNNFTSLSPGYLCNKRDGLLLFPDHLPRVIFSHNKPIGRYFPKRKVVFLTRTFLDIVVSYYYFHKHRGKTYYKDLDINEFVMNVFNIKEATKRINYFSSQLESSKSTLIIPYERLRNKPEEEFRRLIMFTNYEYNEESFYAALEHSSFKSMREMEKKQKDLNSEEAYHTRKGSVQENSKLLDDETKTYVQNLLEKYLKGKLKDYYLGKHIE